MQRVRALMKMCLPPTARSLMRLSIFFFGRPAHSSWLFSITPQRWRDFVIPLPDTSLAWALSWVRWRVSFHGLDEPWAPPASNCPHHLSDRELTNSASLQLAGRLRWDGRAGRDDGVIRYLCLLLCVVQQGVACNSRSSDGVCHLLHYRGR